MLKNELVQQNISISFSPLSGECVSSFKNTGDFVIRALCSDHVIGKFRCKQNVSIKVSPHTLVIGLPKAQKRYTQNRFARASATTLFSVVSLFGAIMAPEFKLIYVVHMCKRSCGIKCDDSTMSCDDSVKNKHYIFRLSTLKQGKILRQKIKQKLYSFGISQVM